MKVVGGLILNGWEIAVEDENGKLRSFRRFNEGSSWEEFNIMGHWALVNPPMKHHLENLYFLYLKERNLR